MLSLIFTAGKSIRSSKLVRSKRSQPGLRPNVNTIYLEFYLILVISNTI